MCMNINHLTQARFNVLAISPFLGLHHRLQTSLNPDWLGGRELTERARKACAIICDALSKTNPPLFFNHCSTTPRLFLWMSVR